MYTKYQVYTLLETIFVVIQVVEIWRTERKDNSSSYSIMSVHHWKAVLLDLRISGVGGWWVLLRDKASTLRDEAPPPSFKVLLSEQVELAIQPRLGTLTHSAHRHRDY